VFLDSSPSEIALVVMILLLVLIAPKVPRIGESIGALLGGGAKTRRPARPKGRKGAEPGR